MKKSKIRFLWENRSAAGGFRTAVSLHSHTLHSHEMLAIIPRTLRKITFQNWNRIQDNKDRDLDVARLWWTPPLSPRQAWLAERTQIEAGLGLDALVSITDHDSIEAPLMLRVLDECQGAPISVEWTAPFRNTFFHVGVHNLEWRRARGIFAEMQAYTANPDDARLGEILTALNEDESVLVILNHPLWDEKGIGHSEHRAVAGELIRTHKEHLHALELNGFRRETENAEVAAMAEAHGLPVVSGGDRHGREPNANLNLTNAGSFAEFVEEVRVDRHSDVLWMPQVRDGLTVRFLRAACDVVRDDPQHGMGWTRWNDRVFYRCDDGECRPLSEIWGNGPAPQILSRMVASVQFIDRFVTRPKIRSASPWAPAEEE